MKKKKAVVLLSGGMDSATTLYWAKSKGYQLLALSVDYGQRHIREMISARKLAALAGAEHLELQLNLPWLKTSSLVDRGRKLPNVPLSRVGRGGIPSTYVPGRNMMLLSLAASLADARGACAVVIGANVLDYSGYPDCRPQFNRAFEAVTRLGTRTGAKGGRILVLTPLIHMDKAEIIRLASRLWVPLQYTWSCYRGGRTPCGACDSCKLRAKGFKEAGCLDPAQNRTELTRRRCD